ncbi:MAG: glycosyltransferase family 9 protein [Ignavibacteria bacterium]|jgi:heptosyltransferase-2|nr:glycosyltransferase family 9 protein [Ignavibacteria bacterium]MCU7501791.1 glycosyltransferase family 9 protein [Ignavibacteria bacterium]MCU7518288.1 glycosyltransferase family 9 protein [Ignavibacteria bacterium]
MSKLRILISRPDRIGDVVLSTPIPREIKKKFPDSYVALLLKPYTRDIYLNNPYVDEIIIYDPSDRKEPFWERVRQIRSYNFTHAIMLLPNEKINYLLFFAGIKTRIGIGHKLYQFLTFTRYVDRKKYIPLRHEADYCMDTARKLGVETDNLDTEIFLTREEVKKVFDLRKQFAPEGQYLIGIHASSGNSAPNWKPSEYRKLLLKLKKLGNIKIAVTDNLIADELRDIPDVIYPNVNLSLRDSIVNFASLDLLISASTGPMHLAAALKVRTLSLFCPMTACSPKLWGPKGNKAHIMLPLGNYCDSVCNSDPKKCTFEGANGISSDKVYSEVLNILSVENNVTVDPFLHDF